jgi:hypothetical protein
MHKEKEKEANAMENILQFANTVMESVVEPAQKTTLPPAWVSLLERGLQFLKVVLACCQVLEWIGLL